MIPSGSPDSAVRMPTRELWDEVWRQSGVVRGTHDAILTAIAQSLDLREARTLEIGCGSAVDSVALAQMGARALAADYSLSALGQAREYGSRAGVNLPLVAADVFRLPFATGAFDLVFSQGLMEHFRDPLPGVVEQARILKSGGILCLDVPQTYSVYNVRKRRLIRQGKWFAGWETSFSLGELETLVRRADLEVIGAYGYQYDPAALLAIRHLHTLHQRRRVPVHLPEPASARIEGAWRWLERRRWYFRWLTCIGVIGRKK